VAVELVATHLEIATGVLVARAAVAEELLAVRLL
jgi:hypothetical protein